LSTHAEVVKQTMVRKQMVLGALSHNRQDLEARRADKEALAERIE
jgi:hypothetical protein